MGIGLLYLAAEHILFHVLSPLTQHLGIRVLTLSGPVPEQGLPAALETPSLGVRVRSLSNQTWLMRPRAWRESGPSADPSLPCTVGVLQVDGARWHLSVRYAVVWLPLFLAVGCLGLGVDAWPLWLGWSISCFGLWLAWLLRARAVFRRIGAQLG